MSEKNGEHPAGDAVQAILLVLFLVGWVADSFFFPVSRVVADTVPLWVRLPVAAVVFVGALLFMKAGHVVVDDDERPSTVVDTGAFRWVRHPLYLGCVLFYLALVIATGSLVALALFVVNFLFYNYIATYEERLLVRRFGNDYRTYMARTGKWIPRISGG